MIAVRNHHLNVISEGWATSRAAATTIAPAVQHTAAWAGGTRVQLRRSTMDFSKRCDARDRRESEQHEQAATRHEFLYHGTGHSAATHLLSPFGSVFPFWISSETNLFFEGGPPGRITEKETIAFTRLALSSQSRSVLVWETRGQNLPRTLGSARAPCGVGPSPSKWYRSRWLRSQSRGRLSRPCAMRSPFAVVRRAWQLTSSFGTATDAS